ncbi:MAG: phospholipase D-like domain-containing protein [Marinomonas sp.]
MKAPAPSLPFEASVEPGVWRYDHADKLTVLVDAEEYFLQIQSAMLKAEQEILLLGWDFDTRIHLARGRRWYQRPFNRGYPSRLGSFLLWLPRKRKGLDIKLLVWGYSFLQFLTRGSMGLDMLRMAAKRQIQFKHDTQLPFGCSHHQKIAVLDRSLAVCGGIDLTRERWDSRKHHKVDPRRRTIWGSAYQPWHDMSVMMQGDIAGALFDLTQERWERAGGEPLKQVEEARGHCWPDDLEVHFKDVEVGISRSRPAHDDAEAIDEVEALFLRHIKQAQRFIYIENQYLTSRSIVEAMVSRLQEDDPPEIIMVHPREAEGWLEQQAMDHTRSSLVKTLRAADHKKRFHLYVAYTGDLAIYVHSKLMIVDDQILRVGSANLNNRSMGLDSECDVFIDTARPANNGHTDAVTRLRHALLAEHCGLDEDDAAKLFGAAESISQVIEEHGMAGDRRLERFEIPDEAEMSEFLADSQILDPEVPEEMFAAYPKGGLYRPGSVLYRAREKLRRGQRSNKGRDA